MSQVDDLLKSFLSSGNQSNAIEAIMLCQKYKYIALSLCKYFLDIFPTDVQILNEYANYLIACEKYRDAYKVFDKILSFAIPEQLSKIILQSQTQCIENISNDFIFYNDEIVKKIQREKNEIPLITFTITTCKRYELFEKTINSFLNCCLDIHLIDKWLCVDDNSSEEDREKMRTKYPFFEFYFKTVNEKGHPRSMNIIRDKVTTPYLFHMEDDWKFFAQRKYISLCLEIIQAEKVGQVLINRNFAETEKDIDITGGLLSVTRSGKRYYTHEHYKNKTEEEDFRKKYGIVKNVAYWPHFSFRPSLMKSNILKDLGTFDEEANHFEMKYSYTYRDKGYLSTFFEGINCIHIGRLTNERFSNDKANAYILNGEKQLHGKENVKKERTELKYSFKTYVLNMERRLDRWLQFQNNAENVKEILQYDRYDAIDGAQLQPNIQLQRIFEGNDYNMREGMVGCAMSHIKMYIELVKSQKDFFCILEDDITFDKSFSEKFKTVLSDLENVAWDLCYLGHHIRPEFANFELPSDNSSITKWDAKKSLTMSLGGTIGYLISRKGAENLLNFINTHGMTNGIDTVQQKSADTLNVYYAIPHLVFSKCCTKETLADTDIQNNLRSLSIPFDMMYEQELSFYKNNYDLFTDDKKALCYIQQPELDKTLIYTGVKVRELVEEAKKHDKKYYTVYGMMLVIPKGEGSYVDRLKKNNEYNISDALEKRKTSRKHFIPFGETTHMTEAIKSLNVEQVLDGPFNNIDEETLETCLYILENVLDLDEEGLEEYVTNFCGQRSEGNEKVGNRLRNNKLKIVFPHEDVLCLVSIYMKKFKRLVEIIKSGEEIILLHETRFVRDGLELFCHLADILLVYNKNIKIFTINGIGNFEQIPKKYKGILYKDSVPFPTQFRNMDWTYEKIKYDQEVYRVAIIEPLKKFFFPN